MWLGTSTDHERAFSFGAHLNPPSLKIYSLGVELQSRVYVVRFGTPRREVDEKTPPGFTDILRLYRTQPESNDPVGSCKA